MKKRDVKNQKNIALIMIFSLVVLISLSALTYMYATGFTVKKPVITKSLCGDGVCGDGEDCEWYGIENRQMLCDGNKSNVISGVVCGGCKTYYNMKKVYYPRNYSFIFESNNTVLEKTSWESWGDGSHFTAHRNYFNMNELITWCPRTDDVYEWSGELLYYKDTYTFYPNENSLVSYSPGHVWARGSMQAGVNYTYMMNGTFYDIVHNDCRVVTKTINAENSNNNIVTVAGITDDLESWSPFTGGSSTPVKVFRLDEYTFIGSDEWWKEEWYFYNDPLYGFIPIASKGYHQSSWVLPNNTLLWDQRLKEVQSN